MKSVNLLPGHAPVVAATKGDTNLGMIGGAAAGLLAVVGVAAYFAMARVDSVKSETTLAQTKAAQATEEITAVNARVQSLGTPTPDSDKQIARGAERVLVAAYTQRHNYPNLLAELKKIMDGTDGWYTNIEVRTHPGDSTPQVLVEGYMPDADLMASFNERANLQSTIEGAETIDLREEGQFDRKTRKNAIFWYFKMTADLVDTVQPTMSSPVDEVDPSGATSGTTVSDGGNEGVELAIADNPPRRQEPKLPAPTKQPVKKAAASANPFDVAASVAGNGGTS